MRYPKGLPENGTIGFVAPSFGCAAEPYKTAFDTALNKWHSAGYSTELGPNTYTDKGIGISNSPEKCAEELMDFYCDEDSDVLISCGGGELMCETVSYVDFDRIRGAEPKWFMGFSDNTNFTFLLNTLADTAAIYGPCAAAFGSEPEHRSISDARRLITGSDREIHLKGYDKWELEGIRDEDHPLAGYNLDHDSYVRAYMGNGKAFDGREASHVSMHGRLTGGCLDCLVNLCGTRLDKAVDFADRYASDGIIWFLEACDLNPMGMRRAMWELDQAGWFKNAAGFIIGRPLHFYEEMMGLDHYKAFYDVISKYKVPVIMDADLGHLPPMLPVVSGSLADVCAGDGKWDITMKFL